MDVQPLSTMYVSATALEETQLSYGNQHLASLLNMQTFSHPAACQAHSKQKLACMHTCGVLMLLYFDGGQQHHSRISCPLFTCQVRGRCAAGGQGRLQRLPPVHRVGSHRAAQRRDRHGGSGKVRLQTFQQQLPTTFMPETFLWLRFMYNDVMCYIVLG
jgi:hypothetical protein